MAERSTSPFLVGAALLLLVAALLGVAGLITARPTEPLPAAVAATATPVSVAAAAPAPTFATDPNWWKLEQPVDPALVDVQHAARVLHASNDEAAVVDQY